MSASVIARRYAVALFELEQEGKKLSKALHTAAAIVEDKGAAKVLLSPAYPDAVKVAIFSEILKGEGADVVVRLVEMLAKRGKLVLMPEIATQFDIMLDDASGALDVDVTVAIKPTAALEKSLVDALSKSTGKKVSVNVREDARIIGGLIVRMGDRKIDYSLKSKLDGLQQVLAG